MSTDATSRRARAKRNLTQFLKFGIVGGSGVLVNVLVAIVLNKLNGGVQNSDRILFPLFGDFNFRFTNFVWIAGFLVANVTNFQLNRSWTFQSSKAARWWKEFWPFFLVGAVAAAVGFFLKILMKNPTSIFYLPDPWFNDNAGIGLQSREYWAQLLAIILTIPINFLVNKFWTFRAVRHGNPDDVPMVAEVVAPEVMDEAEPTPTRTFTDSVDTPEPRG